ncbi:MAG TPA: CoA pyrophosphatase [Acidimicrobiales bacterium]|nr:CoA pyrophosphatase [Acidimicrobiales bacterium]
MAPDGTRPARFEGHEFPQTLPEPDDIQAGAAAPWSALSDAQRSGLTLELVESRLRDALRHFDNSIIPGDTSALSVADIAGQPIARRSAVLVALFEEDGETQLVLTRRSFSMREHRGEIALPGGRSDLDETPVATALREAREEVGIDESSVRAVGWLSPIVTLALGSAIWPVVGLLTQRPEMVTDPAEVDRAFTVPLADLLADGSFLEERWRRQLPRPGADADGYFPIYFYRVPGDLIWGATARVVTELLCIVTGVEWPEAKRAWP